jgi:hypothetical protein
MAFNRLQYPTDLICLVILWHFRYKLSLQDLAEMFLRRGIIFTHEAVREWESKLAPLLSETLRKRRHGTVGASWYVDETYIRVQGRWCYLYHAIDRDSHLIEARFSDTRDLVAAEAFFRSAWTMTGVTPDRITTDGHDAYLVGYGDDLAIIPSPQNRAHRSPGTRLKPSTYPKRRTGAVKLAMAVVVYQLEIRTIVRAAVFLGNHMVPVQVLAVLQRLVTDGAETPLPPRQLPRASGRGLGSAPPLGPVVL